MFGISQDEYAKSTMNKWWELTKEIDVVKPKTHIIHLTKEEYTSGEDWFTPKVNNKILTRIKKLVDSGEFQYPLFIRTDLASAKEQFIKSCYVEREEDMLDHLRELIVGNRILNIIGLPFTSIVIREYIPLDSRFKSKGTGEMPVGPEIRFFYKDGQFICYHNYWVKDSIWGTDIEEWEPLWEAIDKEIHKTVELVKKQSKKIAEVLPGYWSVDFAKAKDGRWIFIDAADGELSYHEPHEK